MKLILNNITYQKMMSFVDNCQDEISGLGKVVKNGNDYTVTDIALFQQNVSSVSSDITAEALAKFQVELIKKGESLEDWCFWWHSHASMDVFFSGTDIDTINSSTEFPYLISLVTNHEHDFTARIDVYQHARLHAEMDVAVEPYTDEINKDCIEEINKKVTARATLYNHQSKMGFDYKNRDNFNGISVNLDDYSYEYDDEVENYLKQSGQNSFKQISDTISNNGQWSYEKIKEGLQKAGTEEQLLASDELDQQLLQGEILLEEAKEYANKKQVRKIKKQLERLYKLDELRN